MKSGSYRFEQFTLDVGDRTLRRNGAMLDVSNRYFDALVLLVSETGGLVSKNRFLDEVWRGVPVTDEALTQCIKILRRELGDDALHPRYIETVPKHGYRFVATVEQVESRAPVPAKSHFSWLAYFQLGAAGVVGGGISGLLGGLIYGFSSVAQPGTGGASIVLVLTALCVLVALVGATGVSFGIAVALIRGGGWQWHLGGGAIGGFFVGGIAKLLGLDAFNLLLGASPSNITGALEGAALGGAVGIGVWWGRKATSALYSALPAVLAGGIAGVAISLLGGRLMAGSLDLLVQLLPQSRLRLDRFGALFGEENFGPLAQIATGVLEGGLFAACVSVAMSLARQHTANKLMPK
jgi:DNA-binding winged helix-turn-helix (wHTH) protein